MSMVRDDKPEKLEQAGLYRRALSRWLIVLDGCKQDAPREWIIKHRAKLTENIKPLKVTVDNFSDVTRAATATPTELESLNLKAKHLVSRFNRGNTGNGSALNAIYDQSNDFLVYNKRRASQTPSETR